MAGFVERNARKEIFSLKPYVPGKPIEEVERELGLKDIVKMASNENPLGPSPRAQEAVVNAAKDLNLYPDGNCFYLKEKLAEKFDRSQDCFMIGNGSDELLRLITETFVQPSDEVIYGDPSFSEYEFMTCVMGGKVKPVRLANFTYDLQAMKAAVTENTKIIYVCNPNNPTGTVVTREQLEKFMESLDEDILVVFDEAYYEYVDDPEFQSGLEYLDRGYNVIVLRTFSKIYGLAGLRIGYGISTPEIVAAVNRVREPFNVNLVAQKAAVAALEDEEHLTRSREINRQGKEYLYRELQAMGLRYVPTQANFIFLDTGQDCRQVFQQLLRQGVIVRTGDIFGYPTYIRVTVGTDEQNLRFISSLKRVLEG
ncbi:MAG: histidinol-phosphate transaminase [Syntrophothermus sp.]|uniref:histidinol-phosphate transaminase n=1 Tax=Syntrophothermus sp. TaxID=2736299 RepID=UPI00257FB3BB|nr:histidinol-phosphate transaminase [Syntrophothermus sp.]NSW83402.1 histidinol-phosphate transaminase [Syntrophothermus sp.]